jgi:hypothetical protein
VKFADSHRKIYLLSNYNYGTECQHLFRLHARKGTDLICAYACDCIGGKEF